MVGDSIASSEGACPWERWLGHDIAFFCTPIEKRCSEDREYAPVVNVCNGQKTPSSVLDLLQVLLASPPSSGTWTAGWFFQRGVFPLPVGEVVPDE